MSTSTYTYNSAHMDEISAHYHQCVDYTDLAIGTIGKAKNSFVSNYKGQSNDMAPMLYDKIKEHMEFLSECFSQMEAYVTYTKDTMVELDKTL